MCKRKYFLHGRSFGPHRSHISCPCLPISVRFIRWIALIAVLWTFMYYTILMMIKSNLQTSDQVIIQTYQTSNDSNQKHQGFLLPLLMPPLDEAGNSVNSLRQPLMVDLNRGYQSQIGNIIQTLKIRLPNLPVYDLFQKLYVSSNRKCSVYPQLWELNFNNEYWQRYQSSNGTNVYLFAAYYDNRTVLRNHPVIRITAMVDRLSIPPTICQLWFPDFDQPVYAETLFRYLWHAEWGNQMDGAHQPYLITCRIPDLVRHLVPNSVSLVESPCNNATTNLQVLNNRESQKNFAVCVKGLDFYYNDISVRLIEWIELLHLLGSDKIFFYELSVHPNVSKVLKFYEDIGLVQVTRISLPGGQPNFPELRNLYNSFRMVNKRQNELIPYNDCFYRNMYNYKYITLIDVDEIIMPLQGYAWIDVMNKVLDDIYKINGTDDLRDSYCLQNIYFFDNAIKDDDFYKGIPRFLHMLRHLHRSARYTDPLSYIKCFHRTENVIALHNHLPLACLGNPDFACTYHSVNNTIAHLQHYRKDCTIHLRDDCKKAFQTESVYEPAILKYQKPLVERSLNVLHHLGFLHAVGKTF